MKSLIGKVVASLALLAVLVSACSLGGGNPANVESGAVPVSTDDPAVLSVSINGPVEGATMPWVDGSTLVFIPEGSFGMGETGGADNPLHTVQLSPYWIQQSEVTNRQYALCVASGQCSPPMDDRRALAISEATQVDVPVTGVSWDQASTYCSWIQGTLPTEAQWEKAARGPESRIYPWGDTNPSCDLLNFENCVGHPIEVRQYADGQSYYKMFDMAGNVFEWVLDWYDPAYYPVSPPSDPAGAASGTTRSFRSSSYYSFAADVKLARRLYMEPEKFREDLGFRCVVQDPAIQTPYCQVSAVGIKPSGADGSASNSGSCAPPEFEQGNAFCANGNSYSNIFVTSGVLTSVDQSSFCNYGGVTDGTELFTCGPGKTEKTMNICGECTSAPSVNEINCPAGYTANADGSCSWGVAGLDSVGGCPPGWTPGGSNGGGGGGDKGGDGTVCSYQGPKDGEHCPLGTYYDPSIAACVGEMIPGTPTCAAGFTYDPQAQCCVAPSGGSYPGCGPNEFMNEQGFCTPLVINTTSCVDITVSYISCELPPTKVPGEDGGGNTSCQSISCDYPYTFDGVCSCVYNPKP